MLYNFNNSIVSALNFNILKTNLSKIASKEVKIYVFENYFLKKRSCATATAVTCWRFFYPSIFSVKPKMRNEVFETSIIIGNISSTVHSVAFV